MKSSLRGRLLLLLFCGLLASCSCQENVTSSVNSTADKIISKDSGAVENLTPISGDTTVPPVTSTLIVISTTVAPETSTTANTTSTTPATSSSTTPAPSPTPTPIPTTTPTNTTTPTPTPTTTAKPPTPVPCHHFDGPSFIGGIVLTLGLLAIGVVAYKFYKAHNERNYHIL